MSTSYLERLNQSFENQSPEVARPSELSKAQIEHAFAWRTREELDELATISDDYLDVSSLPPEDQLLFRQRVLGGIALRIDLGSHDAHARNPNIKTFSELSDTAQLDVLGEAALNFSRKLSIQLADATIAKALRSTATAARRLANSDPLYITHRYIRNRLHTYKVSQLTKAEHRQRLMAYLDVRVGSFSRHRLPDRAVGLHDSMLVQAFGRNSYTDNQLPMVQRLYRTEAGRSDLRMWDILQAEQFDPGASNRTLAAAVKDRLESSGAIEPILQWEVAYALWEAAPGLYARYQNYMHTLWPKGTFYPTYEVKKDSVKIMDAFGLYNPLELAHPDMEIRSLGILSKLGVEADPLIVAVPFDKKSTQRQTKKPMWWVPRETSTRLHHILRGLVKL